MELHLGKTGRGPTALRLSAGDRITFSTELGDEFIHVLSLAPLLYISQRSTA